MSALDTPLAVVAHAGELRAAEKVARRFYLEDRSKIEIASEMGLSRSC
jgi:DNA-binding transcriptional regulator LsrR (DeoR family)